LPDAGIWFSALGSAFLAGAMVVALMLGMNAFGIGPRNRTVDCLCTTWIVSCVAFGSTVGRATGHPLTVGAVALVLAMAGGVLIRRRAA
jgi:hypothetical protein